MGLGMQVFLDDVALSVPNASLSAALEKATELAQARGRIVVEVLCDGRPATEEMLRGDAMAFPGDVRCISADPHELILATLEDAVRELDLLVLDQKQACETIWRGSMDVAMERLRDILKRWEMLRGAMSQCASAAGLAIEDLRTDSGSGADEVAGLARDLEQVRTELSAGRTVELADVVGTDLCLRARGWQGVFGAMAGEVRQRMAGGMGA